MRITDPLVFWVAKNTFFALIPVVLAYTIYWLAGLPGRRVQLLLKVPVFALGMVWLAFLPNTCYLLTEWRHFLATVGYSDLYARWQVDSDAALRLMTYTFFYLCYSGMGVLTFTLAVRPIARLMKKSGATMWIWATPFFALMSVGVYLGLVLRFNSWELIGRPGEIWTAVVGISARPTLSSFIIAFAGFLWVAYTAVDIWIDGFLARWREWLGTPAHQPDISSPTRTGPPH